MYVERAFEILKGRWKLIIEQSKIPMRNKSGTIVTYIILHNLFLANNKWIEDE